MDKSRNRNMDYDTNIVYFIDKCVDNFDHDGSSAQLEEWTGIIFKSKTDCTWWIEEKKSESYCGFLCLSSAIWWLYY